MTALRRLGCAVAAIAAIAAIAAAVAGWVEDRPEITSTDAITATTDAFSRAAVTATVAVDPILDTYASRSQPTVDVWRVEATVGGGQVDLYLARADAQPVAIDDRTPDRSAYLLTAGEFEAVAANVEDPSLDRALRRRLGLTVGAVLILGLAIAIVLAEPRRRA